MNMQLAFSVSITPVAVSIAGKIWLAMHLLLCYFGAVPA
jgi:hypothetical protein